MKSSFNVEKWSFFNKLSANEHATNLIDETLVRDLIDEMIEYQNNANHAAYFSKRNNMFEEQLHRLGLYQKKSNHLKKNWGLDYMLKSMEAFFTEQNKALALDFSDVEEIAYVVGTYEHKRRLIPRLFTAEHQLDARVRYFTRCYQDFRKTGEMHPEYVDTEAYNYLAIAFNPEVKTEDREESMHQLHRKSWDYMNRQGTLLRLVSLKDNLHDHYTGLSKKQIKKIAGYFQRQAEIDGLQFKMLHTSWLSWTEQSDPIDVTENIHQVFIESLKSGVLPMIVYGQYGILGDAK